MGGHFGKIEVSRIEFWISLFNQSFYWKIEVDTIAFRMISVKLTLKHSFNFSRQPCNLTPVEELKIKNQTCVCKRVDQINRKMYLWKSWRHYGVQRKKISSWRRMLWAATYRHTNPSLHKPTSSSFSALATNCLREFI